MTVAFGAVYQRQSGGRWTYLVAADSKVSANTPWMGVYIASDFQQNLGQLASLSAIFRQFENHSFLSLAHLYFAASAAPDPQKIGAALDSINWNADRNHGTITWIEDPSAIDQAAINAASKLPFALVGSGRAPVFPGLSSPERQPLIDLSPGQANGERLFIASQSNTVVKLGSNGAGDALVLSGDSPLRVARGITAADTGKIIVDQISAVNIPVTGTNCGCLSFGGRLATPVSGLVVGFQFAVTTAQGGIIPSGPLSYPLLDAPDGLANRPVTALLSVLAPLDIAHTYLAVNKADGVIRSAFRTLLDHIVLLTPQADGSSRLVFNVGFDGTRYLTPHGAFAMSIDGGSEPSKYGLGSQLLCGLSGVEYVHFSLGDLLQFHSGAPAAVTAQIDPDLPKPANVTFAFDASGKAKTAWAMVLPADSSQPDARQYYSEPDQTPFFAVTDLSSNPRELGYYALTLSQLPSDAGPTTKPYQFPLLPYASFTAAASGFGADPVYVEAFEFQLINPTRKELIEAMSVSTPPQSHTHASTDSVTAITPEGYAAAFADKAWQAIRVAQMSSNHADIEIGFAAATGASQIPRALQDAFLTNQQFLVITSPTNLGAFTARVVMDQWPFIIDLTKNTTVGDYRNIILFKSANATVSQLVRHPKLWTHYAEFNNVTSDPDGRFLSNWLVDYLDKAKALYDNGNGVASLADFCALIDDPSWNGFLALRVDIDIQNLPGPVEALLAGIDKSLFVAHHIGNKVNHVTPPSKGAPDYTLNSAMFGLVHYVDPALGAQVNNIPPYIANPQSYDFRVLTLEAVFENALLLEFSNKSLLTLNTLFGDAVQQNSATGAPGANTLVLIGSYNANSDPAYSFSTAKGAVADFYMSSNALDRIEVTRTTMTVTQTPTIKTNVSGEQRYSKTTQTITPPAGRTAYLACFNLSGNLRLAASSTFDLLSYQSLGFENLGLDMYLVSGGGDRSFAFDSSAMRVTLAQNVAVDPSSDDDDDRATAGSNLVRIGSLLAQFPLQLQGFITGGGGRLPDAMGFRTLHTTRPDGITPATLSGDWYALSFALNLGGQGALGQNGGLSAQMLLAWSPGGQPAQPSVLPALKIAGPGGVSLSFDLEGVVKFGAADIVLNKMQSQDKTADQFVLMFESIAFSILSFSFPPQGTTNVFLFGDATNVPHGTLLKPTLGWFGGYVEQPAPAKSAGV